MNISNALGLLTAILGLTTTIHGGWKYLSSSERSKKERIGTVVVVVGIMGVVLGASTGISYATASTPVGQQTIPVPFVPTAAPTAPSAPPASPQASPTVSPAPTPTPTPTPQLSPTSAPTPTPQLSPTSSPTPTPMATPEPTGTPTSTLEQPSPPVATPTK